MALRGLVEPREGIGLRMPCLGEEAVQKGWNPTNVSHNLRRTHYLMFDCLLTAFPKVRVG